MQHHINEDSWRNVISSLESLLPYYERTNLVNTLFLLPLWRREISNNVRDDEIVLEIGSGPGGLSRLLRARRILCLDPSVPMLRYAKDRLDGGRFDYVGALAENPPLSAGCFDAILCSFSFRDFMDKEKAFREMFRLLRPGGRLHILELLRPDEGWRRSFLDLWIERAVPAIARMLVPRRVSRAWKNNPFDDFAMTYKAMSPVTEYLRIAKEAGFTDVRARFLGMRAVFHLQGVKGRTT